MAQEHKTNQGTQLNPFRARKPLSLLIPNNFVSKTGFQFPFLEEISGSRIGRGLGGGEGAREKGGRSRGGRGRMGGEGEGE